MTLSIHYTPNMVANADSYSPSAGKPAQVVASWAEYGLPLTISEPPPVSIDQLALGHDRAFVENMLAGKINNGFGNKRPEVAASLPWTSGAMLVAPPAPRCKINAAQSPPVRVFITPVTTLPVAIAPSTAL